MRLAHVCSSDLAIPALAPFCTPLVERGWEVTMITPDGPHVPSAERFGLRWLPFALERRLDVRSDVVGTLQLARYCRRERFDIVHTHNIKAGHIGRVVAASMRVPHVVHTVHGMAYSLHETPLVKRTLHAVAERIANLGCDLVFSQSREDRDTLVATYAVAKDRIVVIGNGIDLSKFTPATDEARVSARRALRLADADVAFLSGGRLTAEKGFLEVFEAAKLARREDPRIRMLVAGEPDLRTDAIDRPTLDAAVEAGIDLLGRRSDMPALYAAADVVMLASWHEGVPRLLMEGASMGKPLLATDVRGCREVVAPPRNGLLVPVQNARALANGMLALARDAALRDRLGRANAVEARERYDIAMSVKHVLDGYERLLG